MPPVRRHRTFDQLPAVIHPGPDPADFDLCRELAVEADAQAVVLFGSRATGGWDEQSDLDLIIVHPAADEEDDRRRSLGRALVELKERHYPGYGDYDSPHQGVADGLMVETPHLHQESPGRGRLPPRRRRLQRVGIGDPGKTAEGVRGSP